MDYRVEQMSAFRLLGKAEKQSVNNVQANWFWERCKADGTLKALTAYSTSPDQEYIGMADGASFDGECYQYYIATPYSGAEIPQGYVVKDVPACLWIKFRCASLGAENTADMDIYQKIYTEFLPASDYVPAEYQLEVYPRGDGSYPDHLSEVWVAVKQKV